MGVDIQTYRARIGSHKNSLCGEAIKNYRHSRSSDVAALVTNIKISNGLKNVGCLLFIGILLMIAGVEPNPGPVEKGDDSEGPEMIKISKLAANINKEMLSMFFDNKIECGGKVVDVTVNANECYAIVEFDKSAAVDEVMNKRPLSIFGFEVEVDIFDVVELQRKPRIRISGLIENTKKEMLAMYFEHEERNGGGKVKYIEMDQKGKFAIIDFEEKEGADAFMLRNPKSILGMNVTVEVIGSDTLTEEPKMIKLTKISVDMNRVMLKRFFDNAIECGGKVVELTVNSKERFAIVTFDTSAAVYEMINKTPLAILGFKIDAYVYTGKDDSETDHAGRGMQGAESLQTTETKTVARAKTGPTECDGKEPDSLKINEINKVAQKETGPAKCNEQEPDSLQENKTNKIAQKKTVPTERNEKEQKYLQENKTNKVTKNKTAPADFKLNEREPNSSQENKTNKVAKTKTGPTKCNEKEPDSLQGNKTNNVAQKKTAPIERNEKEQNSLQDNKTNKVAQKNTGPSKCNEKEPDSLQENKTNKVAQKKTAPTECIENESLPENKTSPVACEESGSTKGNDREPDSVQGNKTITDPRAETGHTECEGKEQHTSQDNGSDTLTEEPNMIILTKLSVDITRAMLKRFFENAIECGGKVVTVTVNTKERSAIVTFDTPAAVYEMMNKTPLTILGFKIDVGVYKTNYVVRPGNAPSDYVDKELDSSRENVKSDIQEENSSQRADIADSDGNIFWQMLQQLQLTDKYPGKITIKDVVVVDPNESNEQQKGKICLVDIPWLILRRLLCSHSESRDMSVPDEPNFDDNIGLDNTLSFISEMPDDKQDISPLDMFFIIFLCCDPFLKQMFVQKLYLCKIAVPFFYKFWENKEKCLPTLSVWPLRSLSIENKQQSDHNIEVQCKETDIMDLQTKMIAFGRFGRPRYSKSKLINSILSSQGCKTFFNIDCPSGMTQRKLSNGQIEMFWLPTIDDKKDRFQETMTFVNLRGAVEQHFDADSLSFVANFVDAFAMIVDSDTILKQGRVIKDILLTFSSVILIFANPLKADTIRIIQNFQKDILTCRSDINIRVLSTHKGVIEQNVVDMVSSISQHIACHLKSSCSKSYQERLQQVYLKNFSINLRTDEEGVNCKIGNEEATKMIQQMRAGGTSSSWKLQLTPVHSKFSQKLGKLIKWRERAKCFEDGNTIDADIKKVRQDQTMNISTTVKLFTSTLMRHKGNLYILKYFLCWLHFFIEKEKRQTLPQLMYENRQAWNKLKDLKGKEPQIQSDIEEQEKIITKLEVKIDEASFSVQHFFREIGHIYEAILQLGNECTAFGLPPLNQMSNLVGCLIADGHQFELIDGESFFMPYEWIKYVVNEVDLCIGSGKVLALSILGLQSSGKSTFLNTMFGCQFSTRTGRCTRGIHVQLIPVNTAKCKNISSDYNFVLVVDTEGLRSPELSHYQHEHDNELATVITGIGDVTLINIMGENTSEIRDILQVIVHAFLRLKMANKDLDIMKSCSFIHQNVTDTSASKNMISGLSKLIKTLDEMTKESAKNEGISNINTFNQVIEFDINSQVWYLKNLWQGNPPMARVNTEYSESVIEIKSNVLQNALTMKDKSYKSLKDITEHAFNLWKGVLNEDFVFSFRNSIEIKAYMAMEQVVQKQLWNLESFIQEELMKLSRDSFANCEKEEELLNVSKTVQTIMTNLLFEEKHKSRDAIEKYFKGDKNKDIIIQWKKSQENRFDFLCQKLEQIISEQVEKGLEKRGIEILTNNCQEEHEQELRKMSMTVAKRNKDKTLRPDEIDSLFDGIWQSFVKKVNTPSSRSEQNRRKMIDIFRTSLLNEFKSHFAVLKGYLEQSQNLTPLPNVTFLRGTFHNTGINEKDINFTWFQTGKKILKGASNAMAYIQSRVDEVFGTIDDFIDGLCRVNEEITEMSVELLMHELENCINAILKGDTKYKFQIPFYVKMYVHVSRYAHVVFEKHNEDYFRAHGSVARLERYRVQQKISFEAHLSSRYTEDVVSDLFTNVIECFSEEYTLQNLSNHAFKKLYANLPAVKNTVIIEICSDLLKKKDFSSFLGYIRDPKVYARSWLTGKANRYLFGEKQYAKLSLILLKDVFSTVEASVSDVGYQCKDLSHPIRTENWIESFRKLMKDSKFTIKSEDFKILKKETEIIKDLEYLTSKILEKIKESETCLVSRFENTDSNSVKWMDANPIDSYVKSAWGCQEQCSFCGEPCPQTEDHFESNKSHTCIQHRPLCCIGNRSLDNELACLESCEFLIQTDDAHTCGLFNYACNDGKREKCDQKHRLNEYKKHLKDWYIAPSSNMHDNSVYWMWFVANFEEELEEYHEYKLSNIPPSWKDITDDQALESLLNIYPTEMI